MRFTFVAAVLAAIQVSLAAIDITGPSSSDYWVQFSSNTITWTYTSGDPTPISIIVQNSNNTFLNGVFSIAEYVDVATESFTITNVTLVVASGYTVEFVNPSNQSDIYATSNSFAVMPNGTAAAATSSAASSSSGSPSSTSNGSSASTTGPSSSGSRSSSTTANAAPRNVGGINTQGVIGVVAACGIASLSALLL